MNIVRANELRIGDVVRIDHGSYRDGQADLIVSGEPYRESASYLRVPIYQWSVWTLRLRARSYVERVGRVEITNSNGS